MAESPEIFVKLDEGTDPAYGCTPMERPVQEYIHKGIVNLDKTSGPTSHQASSWVKGIFGVSKAGHSGTLDPKVTGVLPIGIEDATKVLQGLLQSGKQYVCLMKIHGDVSASQLKNILSYFQAEIYQRPPVKSAVKRELRTRTIYSIELMEKDGNHVLFKVDSAAGTYIRKLCHDIGLILGVGAHMQELRRTRSGPFTEETIVTLHDLKDAYQIYVEEKDETKLRKLIQPMEAAVEKLPKLWLRDSAVSSICHGATLNAPGISKLSSNIKKRDVVALMTLKNELVALAISQEDSKKILEMEKGVVATPERVIMNPDTYPKQWKTSKVI
ncbi:MAG: RNA-guided pseudouridylation complex pseudouridine synthase subunit Cbf5 [Candidatus Altiarchaeota archaeon]|nr:RNA-guided pseudouridylation complex pseudouridine synthase subunit Cbf5 [Candidatus Altiarchaeota archaeon]